MNQPEPHLVCHPTIYLNARGVSTDALYVRGGHVVATGHEAIARAKRDGAPTIRPEAQCLMPALADAHIHLWGIGQRAGARDLSGLSLDDTYAAIARAAPSSSGWVLGAGWDDHGWDGRGLSRARLDALWPARPVCVHRHDRHAVFVNSEALRRAGLGGDQGLLVDEAIGPVTRAIPAASEEEHEAILLAWSARLREMGIVSAHMAWSSWAEWEMLQRVAARGDLGLRVHTMIDAREVIDRPDRRPVIDDLARVQARAVKFFGDGALGSRGALLSRAYLGTGEHGHAIWSWEALDTQIPALMARGWQVAVHAIGDRAVEGVLDAMARASRAERARTRPRIEHAQVIAPAQIARMAQLGVLASIQPIHLRSDAPWVDRVIAPELVRERLFRWRDMADQGVALSGGSDAPIDDPNPWRAIATCAKRQGADGRALTLDQALYRQEAIALYTEGAAYAAHWEARTGRLEVGFVADWIALDRDPFCCGDDQIAHTRVLEVYTA